MSEFLKLAYELLGNIVMNILGFFTTIGGAFVKLFFTDIKGYVSIFLAYTAYFGPFQWVLAILLVVLLVGVIVLIVWKLLLFIKRKIAQKRDKLNEEDLLREIGALNRQVVDLIDEKNKIMAMQVSQLGLNPDDAEGLVSLKDKNKEKQALGGEQRFTKLAMVDDKYRNYEVPAFNESLGLEDLVERYRNFAASKMGLYYKSEIIRLFLSGMAASQIIILEGISGTGKTSLPYSFSRFLNNPASLVSVQPSFRDRTELLGYFNEFTKRFNETEFLRSVYEAGYREEPTFIVLDEMNLARIEYYFAEMLSVLEMPSTDEWLIDLVPVGWPEDPKLMNDGKIKVSNNIWFVGTANNDDSTFTITDKVYDRATPIEINDKAAPFEAPETEPVNLSADHLRKLFQQAKEDFPISPATRTKLDKLDGYITTRFKLAFGNRILRQMESFVPVYVACGGTEGEALDYIIARKILKKFESMNISYVRDEIKELILFIEKIFGKTGLPESKRYLQKIQNLF